EDGGGDGVGQREAADDESQDADAGQQRGEERGRRAEELAQLARELDVDARHALPDAQRHRIRVLAVAPPDRGAGVEVGGGERHRARGEHGAQERVLRDPLRARVGDRHHHESIGRGRGMGAGFTAGGRLPASAVAAIAAVPGVAGVQPQVMLPLNPSTSQFMTLTQELVLGFDLSVPMLNRHYRSLPVRAGRFLREGDRRVAVLGAAFAASRGLGVGSRLTLEGESYEVVGVLDRMLTAPDRFVMVPIADARAPWVAKDALLRTVLASGAMPLTASDLNTGAAVGWRDGEDPDAVALRIRERVPGVNVQLPSEL